MRQLLPIALVIGIVAISILILRRVFKRVFVSEGALEAEKILPFLIGTIGGYYGLLTGFILSIAWGDVQALRNSSLVELNALADVERIATSLPEPTATELKRNVGRYLRSVIDDDMTAMRHGEISSATTAEYDRLWATVAGARSEATAWQASLLGRALDKVGVVGDQRRIRLLISTETLPPIVWAILLIGGAIILSGATIVTLRYGPPAREIMVAVAAVLCVVLFAIYAMDRPYRHGLAPGLGRYEMMWQALHGSELQTNRR